MVKNRIIHILFVLLSIITISAFCNAQVRVKGYYRKDGAYVRPHVRSNPDGNPYMRLKATPMCSSSKGRIRNMKKIN